MVHPHSTAAAAIRAAQRAEERRARPTPREEEKAPTSAGLVDATIPCFCRR